MSEKAEKIMRELTKIRTCLVPRPFRLRFISLEPVGDIYEAEMQPQHFDKLVRARELDACEIQDKGVFAIIVTPISPIVVWRGRKPAEPADLHFARRVNRGGGEDG